ncbi:hypothetical protein K7432_007915 [Basidiobolus ranarum]|uniref:Structure-specific endonuclease subunit SLX4 n=1 Tax=Basidiobolus ranarum TaxID=34480 RepID=A0ABR2WSN0_9FUNG
MDTDSDDAFETPPLQRTFRTNKAQLQLMEHDAQVNKVEELETSLSIPRKKRSVSLEPCDPPSSITLKVTKTFGLNSKRLKRSEESYKLNTVENTVPKRKFILDCVELLTDRGVSSYGSRSNHEMSFLVPNSEKKKSLSPSPDLVQPEESLKESENIQPELGVESDVDREAKTDRRKLSRRQKSVITLDSQDSNSDSDGEWEEERIQFLNVFWEHEAALFQADTFQSFMECKSQLARTQRIYSSSACSRMGDQLGDIVNEYASKSLEKISYFEDQIILLRMDLVQNLKLLVKEREESLKNNFSPRAQSHTSRNSIRSSRESSHKTRSLSRYCLPREKSDMFDDSDTSMMLSDTDEIPMLQTQKSPSQFPGSINLVSQERSKDEEPTPMETTKKAPQGPSEAISSTPLIRTPPLSSDLAGDVKENVVSLETIDDPCVHFDSVLRASSKTPPLITHLPLVFGEDTELVKRSDQREKSPCRSQLTICRSGIKTPPPLQPSSNELDHSTSHEKSLASPTPLDQLYANDEELSENQPSEKSIESYSPDNGESFDDYFGRIVLPWQTSIPQAKSNDSDKNQYERSSDQEIINDEVDLLEFNFMDVEPPSTMYYMPSSSSPPVASNSSFTYKEDLPLNSDPYVVKQSGSASQSSLDTSDLLSPISQAEDCPTTSISMPDYRSMSLDTLKELGEEYGLRAISQETFVSRLELIWKTLNPPLTNNYTNFLRQPAQSSPESNFNFSESLNPSASSASEMDTEEEREGDVYFQDWDLAHSDATEMDTALDTNLEEIFFKFIKNDAELYSSILCYKPVDFEKLCQDMIQAGHVFKQHKLRDFLDSQGIVIIFTKES